MADWFDRQGNPLGDVMAWAFLWEKDDYRRVASDEVDRVHISTVWLGINYRFGGNGPPLIFETMIFGGDYDEYQKRYSTEEEALAGHQKALALVQGNGDG